MKTWTNKVEVEMGKWMLAVGLTVIAGLAGANPSLERTTVLSDRNFDSLIPGALTGGSNPSASYVSNVTSLSPTNSYVIDCRRFSCKDPSGRAPRMFSFTCPTNGWQYASFAFMKGAEDIDFEIRGGYTSKIGIAFWGKLTDTVGICSDDWKIWSSTGKKSVTPNLWHRLHLWFPPLGAKDTTAWMRLDRFDEKKVLYEGEMMKLTPSPAQKRVKQAVEIHFKIEGGNRIFLDDLRSGVCEE